MLAPFFCRRKNQAVLRVLLLKSSWFIWRNNNTCGWKIVLRITRHLARYSWYSLMNLRCNIHWEVKTCENHIIKQTFNMNITAFFPSNPPKPWFFTQAKWVFFGVTQLFPRLVKRMQALGISANGPGKVSMVMFYQLQLVRCRYRCNNLATVTLINNQ